MDKSLHSLDKDCHELDLLIISKIEDIILNFDVKILENLDIDLEDVFSFSRNDQSKLLVDWAYLLVDTSSLEETWWGQFHA
jgi:hypothetical protein